MLCFMFGVIVVIVWNDFEKLQRGREAVNKMATKGQTDRLTSGAEAEYESHSLVIGDGRRSKGSSRCLFRTLRYDGVPSTVSDMSSSELSMTCLVECET